MSRWVGALVALLIGVVVIGVVLTMILKARQTSERVSSQNHLREIVAFAIWHHAMPNQPFEAMRKERFPAATIMNRDLKPDERLSWFVTLLPALDHKKLAPSSIGPAIDVTKAWDVEPNRELGHQRINVFLSPYDVPSKGNEPQVTQYVGIAGLGDDAATLPIESPKGGMFRYDFGVPIDAVKDGLSHTIAVAETNDALGPWIRGGHSTVRDVDPMRSVYIGVGEPFGGLESSGANFAFADGSVRFISSKVSPMLFRAQVTIDGSEVDQLE